jgi:hypothetical protein
LYSANLSNSRCMGSRPNDQTRSAILARLSKVRTNYGKLHIDLVSGASHRAAAHGLPITSRWLITAHVSLKERRTATCMSTVVSCGVW